VVASSSSSSSSSLSSGKFDQASSLMTRRKKFNFAKLKKLNLARNKIRRLPERFFTASNMTHLKTLVMDRNPLETSLFSMSTFEGAHRSLTSLSMNGVDFEFESPQAIDALNLLANLQSLKLNGDSKTNNNRMERRVESDLTLKSLVSLEMQSNGFSSFPQFLCNMENLRELDLSSNRLGTFDLECLLFKLSPSDESVYETTSLRQLNLNNNPLKCDCKMRKLKMWLMRNYDRDLLELIRWKCFEPFELNGKNKFIFILGGY
jgi:Leucine-rich repeat (LRR) protein